MRTEPRPCVCACAQEVAKEPQLCGLAWRAGRVVLVVESSSGAGVDSWAKGVTIMAYHPRLRPRGRAATAAAAADGGGGGGGSDGGSSGGGAAAEEAVEAVGQAEGGGESPIVRVTPEEAA